MELLGLIGAVGVVLVLSVGSVKGGDCSTGCDVKLSDAQLRVRGVFQQGRATAVRFNVTFENTDNGDQIKPSTTGNNFDGLLYVSSTDNSVYPHNADALKDETKFSFSDSKVCTVDNANDMKNGLAKKATRRLYGSCNVTISAKACENANFLCVEYKLQSGAPYTDKDADNNRKCFFVKPKVHCNEGAHCLVGTGSPVMTRCGAGKGFCYNITTDSMPNHMFGCTDQTKEDFCKGKKFRKNCNVCDPSETKDYCNDAGTTKFSLVAMLSTVILAAFL